MADAQITETKSRFNEIALQTGHGPQLQNLADAWTLGQVYWNAKMVPRNVKTPAELMIILMAGTELGFGPTWSLRNIASFNGQAMVHSDGPISLVLKSGLMEWQKSGFEGAPGKDDYAAWFEAKRKGQEKPVRRTFSIGDAKTAGLWGKDVWKAYGGVRMLLMRARAFALRDLFADALGGIGILEEHVGMPTEDEGEEEPTVGSAGLLSALQGEPESVEEPVEVAGEPVEAEGEWEPSPEELAEIEAREQAEAGLFGEQA